MSIERYGVCASILVDARYTLAENLKAYAGQMLKECSQPYVSYEASAIDLHRLTGDAFSRFRPGEIVRVVDEEDGINLRTVDNGSEFSDAARLEKSAITKGKRTKFYYCHPYSSYERGSNECQNKMARRPFPKGTDFSKVPARDIKKHERWMNNYPRKILGWKTPAMLFEEWLTSLS